MKLARVLWFFSSSNLTYRDNVRFLSSNLTYTHNTAQNDV